MTQLDDLRRRTACYVFSFNRGRLLEQSLRTAAASLGDMPIFVVDDGSDDPETLDVLARWADRAPPLPETATGVAGERKTGGLYPNMDRAMSHAVAMGLDHALFHQDDMQFVRPLDETDARDVARYFEANPEAIQLLLHFIKRPAPGEDLARTYRADPAGVAHVRRDPDAHAKGRFCAGGLFHVARTREALPRFSPSEAENGARLRGEGRAYGYLRAPMISFMPAPRSYRRRRRGPEHRLYEWLGGAGFHPVDPMTAEDVAALRARAPDDVPTAETVLRCATAPVPDDWAAGGGAHLAAARGGWRAALVRAIDAAKRPLRRLAGRAA